MPNPYAEALGLFIKGKKTKKILTPSQKRAKKQERETALRLGGQRTPASGSLDIKGDVRVTRKARIECKTTKFKSFAVTLDMVRKIEEAAIVSDELPVILVEFNSNGKPIAEIAIVPSWVLDQICDRD